jgi:hypothetical protein
MLAPEALLITQVRFVRSIAFPPAPPAPPLGLPALPPTPPLPAIVPLLLIVKLEPATRSAVRAAVPVVVALTFMLELIFRVTSIALMPSQL